MARVTFEKCIHLQNLQNAWQIVKLKGSTGGVDNVSLLEYERSLDGNLKTLSEKLKLKQWKPQPYLSISIPKKDGSTRNIGLLTVEDKIVQTAIKLQLEPILEKTFTHSSYAYRPSKGHLKAVRRTMSECVKKANTHYLRLDIDNFFDNIDRELLIRRLRAYINDEDLLELICLLITIGCVDNTYKWERRDKGIPQGAVLSPILANFYLNSFDCSVLSKTASYIRYSDDFVILCASAESARQILDHVESYLQKQMKLILNKPYSVGEIKNGFQFLGVQINKECISISQEKSNEIIERFSSIEMEDGRLSKRYLRMIDGVKNYYMKLLPESFKKPFEDALGAVIYHRIEVNQDKGEKAIKKEWTTNKNTISSCKTYIYIE